MRRPAQFAIGLGLLLLVLICIRIALPTVAKDMINERLANMDGYQGRVEDVDIALFRGAYTLNDLLIVKQSSGGETEPFLSGEAIDLSIQWGALLRGAVVGEVILSGMDVRVIGSGDEGESQTGEEVDWHQFLNDLVPFQLNQVLIENSSVSFRAPGIDMEDALTASEVNGQILNLTNIAEEADPAFADFDLVARVLDAPLNMEGSVNPNADPLLLDINLTLEQVSLPQVNPWFRQYLNVDAQGGTFELYLELAAADGQFDGYAKPIMQDIDIFDLDEDRENFLQGAWEGLVAVAAEVFENQSEEQVAAEIPFSGSTDDLQLGTFAGAVSILRNAFVSAFTSALNQNISLPGAADETDN